MTVRIPKIPRVALAAVIVGVATLLVLMTATSVFGKSHPAATPAPGSAPAPTAAQISQLKTLAGQVSASYGESNPASGTVVSSTRGAANRLVNGATVLDDSGCYVFTVYGHFVASRHPAGVAAPTGSVLTVVVDAATMTPVDVTISKTAPDLSALGQTQNLG